MKKLNTILLVLILITNLMIMIGGKTMAENLYGYCGSKCKHEVYSKQEIDNKFTVINNKFAVVTSNVTIPANATKAKEDVTLPTGFTRSNSVVISTGWASTSNLIMKYGYSGDTGGLIVNAFNENSYVISLELNNTSSSARTYKCQFVLMKIS